MSIIKDTLLEPYFIECDERQYIVKKSTGKVSIIKKTGEEIDVVENMGYYSSRFESIKRIADLQINNSDKVFNLKEYFEEYNGLIRSLITALGE